MSRVANVLNIGHKVGVLYKIAHKLRETEQVWDRQVKVKAG